MTKTACRKTRGSVLKSVRRNRVLLKKKREWVRIGGSRDRETLSCSTSGVVEGGEMFPSTDP